MPEPLTIFVVDDEADYARLLALQLERAGDHAVQCFDGGTAALEAAAADPPDLVLLDVVMPGLDGLETLRRLKAAHPRLPVVMLSAQAVVATALEALRIGAVDYLTKGRDDVAKLEAVVQQVAERRRLRREVEALRRQVGQTSVMARIVGESPAMMRALRLVERALRGDVAVMLLGESGTGKELFAEAIHHHSSRRRHPFVVVNCAAVPRELMESTFFGHEKGAFTGAAQRQAGLFEQAHRGTLFMDEVGELDADLQAKLLRVLQGQAFQRVGGREMLEVDVRIVAATNRDLARAVREGGFREDLYYRLMSFPITLPPLRERGHDVLLLADHLLRGFQARHPELPARTLSPAARRALLRHRWPGNVRELKNAVERAMLLSDGALIEPEDLMLGDPLLTPFAAPAASAERPAEALPHLPHAPAARVHAAAAPTEIVTLDELKRLAVLHAYDLCGGNVDRTATALGVTRSTIYRLMKKYDVDAPTEGRGARDEGGWTRVEG